MKLPSSRVGIVLSVLVLTVAGALFFSTFVPLPNRPESIKAKIKWDLRQIHTVMRFADLSNDYIVIQPFNSDTPNYFFTAVQKDHKFEDDVLYFSVADGKPLRMEFKSDSPVIFAIYKDPAERKTQVMWISASGKVHGF